MGIARPRLMLVLITGAATLVGCSGGANDAPLQVAGGENSGVTGTIVSTTGSGGPTQQLMTPTAPPVNGN